VLPGLLAYQVFANDANIDVRTVKDGDVYGMLVRSVLPGWLTGFFAAVVMGSILSTFNSVLNSSATLFSLGVYKKILKPNATQHQLVRSGRVCSAVVAVLAMIAAPLIFHGRDGLFNVFQELNGIYFIPILAIMLFGFFNRTAGGMTAIIVILAGVPAMIVGTFFTGGKGGWRDDIFSSGFHYMGAVFAFLIILQLVLGQFIQRPSPYVQQDAKVVDLTPWKYAKPAGIGLIVLVLVLYTVLAF